MTLSDYMKSNRLTDARFGALVERERLAVWTWRNGKAFPDPASLRSIYAATNGQVTANDFFHPATEAAE